MLDLSRKFASVGITHVCHLLACECGETLHILTYQEQRTRRGNGRAFPISKKVYDTLLAALGAQASSLGALASETCGNLFWVLAYLLDVDDREERRAAAQHARLVHHVGRLDRRGRALGRVLGAASTGGKKGCAERTR